MSKIKKGMYCKQQKGIPILYVPFPELDLFFSIYVKTGKLGVPVLWDEIRNIYLEKGFNAIDSANFAKECFLMFSDACLRLHEKGKKAFIAVAKTNNPDLRKTFIENTTGDGVLSQTEDNNSEE